MAGLDFKCNWDFRFWPEVFAGEPVTGHWQNLAFSKVRLRATMANRRSRPEAEVPVTFEFVPIGHKPLQN